MREALLKMHLAVFLWGFTGILGRAIKLAEYPLVWYRMLFTSVILYIILYYSNKLKRLTAKEYLNFFLIGSIIAIHWVAFYGSIKYANISIAMVCLSTAGIFTAILSPIFNRTAFVYKELLVGLVAIIGMYFIYTFEFQFATGIGLGIVASLLSAIFTILNKKLVNNFAAQHVAFYEISFGLVFITLLFPLYFHFFPSIKYIPNWEDIGWLLILSFFCTVVGQSLALSALKKLTSFTVVLLVNLEPVYGILLAIYFYQENKELGKGFYIGISLITLSVVLHTLSLVNDRKKIIKNSQV
jgi:drug/metabolite transporter (DMT)-like permease